MNKMTKWGGFLLLILFLAGLVSSCSSSRHLGCPMKITSAPTPTPTHSPADA